VIGKILRLLEQITDIEDIGFEGKESPVGLFSRHHQYELRENTPFIWDIIPNNEDKSLKISITIDKETIPDTKSIRRLIVDTIKENEQFKDFVRGLADFQPENIEVKDLYNPSKYEVKNTKNTITYTKKIKLGNI